MDLAEKYRPKTLDDVFNQDPVVQSLRTLLKRDISELPHSYLFCGHHGCGKTTLAYVLKNELGCTDMNCEYYNTSNTRGIDSIRDLDKTCRFKPFVREGERAIKFIILDECHEMTSSAQNALLALLEKPPAHVYFALCTTDPDKLIATIRSRCHIYNLQSFSRIKLVSLLKTICEKEKANFPNDIYRMIADYSDSSARNALKILDSVIDMTDLDQIKEAIKNGLVDHKEIIDICRMMLDKQYANWTDLCTMLRSIDAKPDDIRRGILNYLSAVAMNSKKYPGHLISMLTLFSESVVYSGMGGLLAQIGLAFGVEEKR